MSNYYIGEIRMFGGNFAIANWSFCNGQLIPISQNETLYTLIGTTYGGDGTSTFALPNMQGRLPIHMGAGTGLSPYVIGQSAGTESVTLNQSTMPAHSHALNATSAPANSQNISASSLPANTTGPLNVDFYVSNVGTPAPSFGAMNGATLGFAGGGSPTHENRMPSLCVTFIISMYGIFPSRN
jgi:microcystin-dependent protein